MITAASIIKNTIIRKGIKKTFLIEKLNEERYKKVLNKEYSKAVFNYKLRNNSFSNEEIIIICNILEIDAMVIFQQLNDEILKLIS